MIKISNKYTKQIISKILIFCLCFSLMGFFPEEEVKAASTATVKCSATGTVNTRASASMSSAIVNRLANGKQLTILEETKGTDGKTWYKVSYTLIATGKTVTAYIRSDYVNLTETSDSTETKEESTNSGTSSSSAPSTLIATGVCNANNVYIRDGAGTNGTKWLASLYQGDQVEILDQTKVNSSVWYQVSANVNNQLYTGWAYGDYIDVSYVNVDLSGDYAQSLKNSGFPDSYIANLVALHEKYPNWNFEAVVTGLDWNTVIAKESINGKNLVQKSADDGKKSTAAGDYNWQTNTWTIYDGSSWVAASSEYIAYCMDPRNFLDETNIFQFENLSYSDSQTLEGVQAILSGTFMAGDFQDADGTSHSYAQTFMDIGKNCGVSPYHLASRVKQEQGLYGTSSMISGTYAGFEGFYNYFNYGAYGSTSQAVIASGLTYARNKGWNTRYASLAGGADLLGSNYINRGQNTLYFQKFNVVNTTSGLYNHQYMGNVSAAITEGQSVAKAYSDKNQAFTFRIPVYTNMPENPASLTTSGNPNNYLSSLSVSGLSLTPSFQGSLTEYTLVVPYSVTSINVSASPVASTSKVSGTGTIDLSQGNNTVTLTCKSQSGSSRSYVLTIARQDPTAEDLQQTAVTSSTYHIDTYVTGLEPGTTAADFLAGLQVTKGSIKLLYTSGEENGGNVCTGNLLALYDPNGTLVATYPIVIHGDVNGDGLVDILDMIKLNRHISGKTILSGAYLEAGDTNRQGDGVDILDMIVLNRHITGKKTIVQ